MVKNLVGKEQIFFATDGAKQEDDWSFRRSNWFKCMEKECKNVKENVGLARYDRICQM